MEKDVGRVLYEGIIENSWIDIVYGKNETKYWIAIKDIDLDNKKIECLEYNNFINKDVISAKIYAENIKSAKVLKGTFFQTPKALIDKLDKFPNKTRWLETQIYNDNILKYLSDCNELDTDAYVQDYYSIPNFSFNELLRNPTEYKIPNESFQMFIDMVLKVNKLDMEEKLSRAEIGISSLAISIGNKKFVIAFNLLKINPLNKTVVMEEKSSINKFFLIDGKRISIFNYLHCDPIEFLETFDEKKEYYKETISKNLSGAEKIDTRPDIFVLRRDMPCNIEELATSIIKMEAEGTLTNPIKAYFGSNISKRKARTKDPFIVIQNKQVNIDQIRVVYNSMVNFITYVQGPPGTGKTKTIINVLLSAMANDRTCLICSNNNKPINDIYDSISFSKNINNTKVEIPFPIIRIGRMKENLKALDKIKDLYIRQKKENTTIHLKMIEETKKDCLKSYSKLKEVLSDYEDKTDIDEKELCLKKLLEGLNNNSAKASIYKQLSILENRKNQLNLINDEDIQNYVIPMDDNPKFFEYLWNYSNFQLNKLKSDNMMPLLEICDIEDEEQKNRQFNKYLKDEENLANFINVFPFVLTTNLSAAKLGTPTPKFDMCIMDEAGQCNIATSLISIIRAKSLLLVGDTNQLRPVIVLEKDLNQKLMKKYNIPNEYNYIENSILSLMREKDETSKNIILRYHYRCPKKIIDFCNQSFYGGELRIKNINDASLQFYDMKNSIPDERNTSVDEADQIVKIIKQKGYNDATIITPFKSQADLINLRLKENGIDNIKVGTIHSVQGAESETIIMSSALSLKTATVTYNWIKNNQELINVGVSRAKKNLELLADYDVIKALDKDSNSLFKQLVEYTRSDGNVATITPNSKIGNNFSNNSSAEKELYETLRPYFEFNNKYEYKRNYKVSKCLNITDGKYLDYYYKAEFDVVIFKKDAFKNLTPKLVIELDGGEHICCEKTYKNDRIKEILCGVVRLPILRVPNSLSKDYNNILAILTNLLGEERELNLFNLD